VRAVLIAGVMAALALPAAAETLQAKAQRLFPQAKIDAVERTPIAGLYEVRSGRTVLYMDESGRYVLVGELYDFTGRKNLTAERLLNLAAVTFDELPLEHAVRLGPANGSRRMAVFDDVDCPFCRRFHKEVVPRLIEDGVGVYVFLHPLTNLHPQAEAKSRAVWCSEDRAGALEAALSDRLPVGQAPRCETPLAKIQELATTLGVTGTPTLILDNGQRIDGFASYDVITAKWRAKAGR
jgi:thiol:disulfide interchange protein DsbC